MEDGWTDRKKRTFINFLVYCPKGTDFLESIDAFHASKSTDLFFKLFKLLEKEFPKLFCSPCVTHCINLMLEDMGKLEEVSEVKPYASRITKYFYNHCYSILAKKDALRVMVTSTEWTNSTYVKEAKAKQFVEQVLDSGFWSKCVDVEKLTEPLVRVLCMVDNEDKPAMDFLYPAMYKARKEMLHKNLHAAGYWLNPTCQFNEEEFEQHMTTTTGLLDVIERYAHGDMYLSTFIQKKKRLEHQKLNDLVYVRYNLRLQNRKKRQQSYDPINLETIDYHVDWVMEDSPTFLTNEEVGALRKNLANMTIQPLSNDIGPLILDDDDVAEAQDTHMENMNLNESNVDYEVTMGDSSEFYNEEGVPKNDNDLTGSCESISDQLVRPLT
ncbi:hypothetical protein GmHk_19G054172 [Glycine max]|nr:hypothetical protein GmHk_19G054172 [Glycine max]